MRKASREMDAAFALEVLDKAPYVTVSMIKSDGSPYGLPLSLVRTDEKTFYFHCALEGDKLDCIRIAGLRAICQRFLPHHMDAFDDAIARSLERTAVVRITLTEPPVGKRKQYDKQGEEMKYGRMK